MEGLKTKFQGSNRFCCVVSLGRWTVSRPLVSKFIVQTSKWFVKLRNILSKFIRAFPQSHRFFKPPKRCFEHQEEIRTTILVGCDSCCCLCFYQCPCPLSRWNALLTCFFPNLCGILFFIIIIIIKLNSYNN